MGIFAKIKSVPFKTAMNPKTTELILDETKKLTSKLTEIAKDNTSVKVVETKPEKQHKKMKWYKSFFYRKDDFQPPYFWITIFCFLTALMVVLRVIMIIYQLIKGQVTIDLVSDTLILGLLAFVNVWAAVYNWNSVKLSNTPPPQ